MFSITCTKSAKVELFTNLNYSSSTDNHLLLRVRRRESNINRKAEK